MTEATAVLLAVAAELTEQAQSSLPKIQEGEKIRREWLENGVYFRETTLNSETFLSQYDFRQRACRRSSATERGEWQRLT